jgi:2-beta-glucuronyltransferase
VDAKKNAARVELSAHVMTKQRKLKAIFITGHHWNSKRKAGFHWLADAFWRNGYEVLFFTSHLSYLSYLRKDHRLQYEDQTAFNRLIRQKEDLWSFLWFTPWHPANLRANFLNELITPLFRRYGTLPLGEAEPFVQASELFIFESTPGLLQYEYLKSINPNARFVYRVSDDLRLLKNHPIVIEVEERIACEFDLVSVPSRKIYERFKTLVPYSKLRLHHHGLHKGMFDLHHLNPYSSILGPHLVFVGVAHFDHAFLERASHLFPDWQFHIIGPISASLQRANVHWYGELPFEATIPYIQHADIGLATWSYVVGAESFSDSLKIIQYTYCQLPIVAPNFISSPRSNVVTYQPNSDSSIRQALLDAQALDRHTVNRDSIWSWDELAELLAQDNGSLASKFKD